jgi:hypothetical protein
MERREQPKKDFSLDEKMDLFPEIHFLMPGAGNETSI